jgi:hypothetical protein
VAVAGEWAPDFKGEKMANAITINSRTKTQNKIRLSGTIVFSGSYTQYAGGGEILDFTKATYKLGEDLASTMLIAIQIQSSNGYNYQTPAPLPQAGALSLQAPLKISTTSATELAAGAYPAGITGDNVTFQADFAANV